MPSPALNEWMTNRLPQLAESEAQCVSHDKATPAIPRLLDECLCGYVVSLSAHFQAFCRELYSDSAGLIVREAGPAIQSLIAVQFAHRTELETANPTRDRIGLDFMRFSFPPPPRPKKDGNAFWYIVDQRMGGNKKLRAQHLNELNKARNKAAHRTFRGIIGVTPAQLRTWTGLCDELTKTFDAVMFARLRDILKADPWPP